MLFQDYTYVGWTKTVVTGWGTIESGGDLSDILLKVDVTPTTDAICQVAESGATIYDGMICARNDDKDSCQVSICVV